MAIFWGIYEKFYRRRGLCFVHCLALCFIFLEHDTMTTNEQERAAYMAGDTKTAELLARIDALQRALGQAVADIEELTDERNALRDELHDLREVLQ
jgi:hypothetical protein